MESLSTLMRKSKIVQSYDVRELIAEAWGKALQALAGAGVEGGAAQALLDSALEREQLAGYPPESDERLKRARAALDTIVSLYLIPADTPLSAAPIFDVSLAQIDVDADVQIRVGGLNDDRVDDYARDMADGDEFPPVTCFFERLPSGNGYILWLADGFHRLDAAKRNALHHVISARVAPGSHRDASEYAATCNARHGLPMTGADKRNAVRRLLHLHPDLASREIARRVGCTHNTVETVRGELSASGQITQIDGQPQPRTVTRAGSTYTYTPPAQQDYAELFQIENCLINYLDVRFGRRGLGDFNAQPRIDCLQSIAQLDDYETFPANLHLPDHYRKSDLKQAVHNVLEQIRQRESQRLARLAGGDDVDGGDGKAVAWSPAPISPAPTTFDVHDVRGEPFYTALLSGSSSGLRSALEGHDLDGADASSALDRALINIFGGNNPARRALASRVILDLIQDTIEDLQAGSDFETPDEPAPPPAAAADTIGCPDCGGFLIHVSQGGGPTRLVCRDCGSVVEPQAVEA